MDSQFDAQTAEQIRLIKMLGLASFVILIYDIFLTLDDEVKYLWLPLREGKRPLLNWMTVIWCVNRYLCPPAYLVIIIVLHYPRMDDIDCNHYIWYPQIMRLIVTTAVGIYFVKLVQAAYSHHRYAIFLTYLLLVTEILVKIWAMADVRGIRHKECTGCFMSSGTPNRPQFVYGYVAELVFDSLMLAATAFKCWSLGIKDTAFIRVIWADSIIFLPIVFSTHLANVLLTAYAPIPLKDIMTSFSSLGCTVIVSRMILNTRKAVEPQYNLSVDYPSRFTTVYEPPAIIWPDAYDPGWPNVNSDDILFDWPKRECATWPTHESLARVTPTIYGASPEASKFETYTSK